MEWSKNYIPAAPLVHTSYPTSSETPGIQPMANTTTANPHSAVLPSLEEWLRWGRNARLIDETLAQEISQMISARQSAK